ncbi:MAG: hypothetical protein R6W77_14950 [Trueperaceae bacterium]
MELTFEEIDGARIAELADEQFVIRSEQDAIDLVGNAAFQGAFVPDRATALARLRP